MRNKTAIRCNFYLPSELIGIVKRVSEGRNESMSMFVQRSILSALDERRETTAKEREYIRLKKAEIESSMDEYIRSQSAKKMTFLVNIRKQMMKFAIKRAKKEDMIYNLKCSIEIAKAYNWVDAVDEINRYIGMVEKNNIELIEGDNGEKKIEDSRRKTDSVDI